MSFPPSRRVRFAPRADANTRVYEYTLVPAGQRLAGDIVVAEADAVMRAPQLAHVAERRRAGWGSH